MAIENLLLRFYYSHGNNNRDLNSHALGERIVLLGESDLFQNDLLRRIRPHAQYSMHNVV